MLPPVDPSILHNNPQFEQIYTHLTTNLLNPDGSTKVKPSQKAQEHALRENLRAAQEQAAQSQLLRKSLGQLSPRAAEGLPDELLEVVDLVAAGLNGRLAPEEREMLADDVEYFLGHLRPIGNALSTHLLNSATQLAGIVYPEESNPRTLQTLTPTLPTHISTLRQTLLAQQDTLATNHLSLATTSCTVLSTHRTLLETIIRILEQTKHGSVARGARSHAEHLSIVAESMEAKLKILEREALRQIYTPEVQSALGNYGEHLRDTRRRLREREGRAEEEVERYEECGGDMKVLVARYGGLLREVEGVRGDIRRLGGEA
ncbi:hypothetical protein FGG08_001018 [Glutinoglossum americanum]|uniref:Uncharacterized protein n=1 Tax=Glutinoglossum americanum TaxID=1670608 RepID=A0A9P8I7K5_9PEZI|nr:hypothetical protein FGG08_001018 [Glutinoglossum americanum]